MMESSELARLLHIDGEEEIQNATFYQGVAEQYLINAGCKKDYENQAFKGLVVSLTAKLLTNPDLLSNLSENTGITLTGLIAQVRECQKANGD